jgi:hypothetical protein
VPAKLADLLDQHQERHLDLAAELLRVLRPTEEPG